MENIVHLAHRCAPLKPDGTGAVEEVWISATSIYAVEYQKLHGEGRYQWVVWYGRGSFVFDSGLHDGAALILEWTGHNV